MLQTNFRASLVLLHPRQVGDGPVPLLRRLASHGEKPKEEGKFIIASSGST